MESSLQVSLEGVNSCWPLPDGRLWQLENRMESSLQVSLEWVNSCHLELQLSLGSAAVYCSCSCHLFLQLSPVAAAVTYFNSCHLQYSSSCLFSTTFLTCVAARKGSGCSCQLLLNNFSCSLKLYTFFLLLCMLCSVYTWVKMYFFFINQLFYFLK